MQAAAQRPATWRKLRVSSSTSSILSRTGTAVQARVFSRRAETAASRPACGVGGTGSTAVEQGSAAIVMAGSSCRDATLAWAGPSHPGRGGMDAPSDFFVSIAGSLRRSDVMTGHRISVGLVLLLVAFGWSAASAAQWEPLPLWGGEAQVAAAQGDSS